MGRKKEKLPVYENIEIIDIAGEGFAIGKYDEVVIFVKKAVPGDIVDVKVTKKKKNYREGVVVNYKKYSDRRTTPFCNHFGICGGCKWQDLSYEDQLFYKQKQVIAALSRIGKVENPVVLPILGSEKTQYYRNKLDYTFSADRWFNNDEPKITDPKERSALGFHVPGMFDKVLDIKCCYLQKGPSNQIRDAVKAHVLENNLANYNIRTHEGFMRNLIIRTSTTGDLMVIVIFSYEDVEKREKLLYYLSNQFPEITSLLYVINSKLNDTYNDLDVIVFKGNDHIYEKMEDLIFKISPKSFYQTNSEQAYKLYCVAREFAQLKGDEIVYDLYTGTGTIANFIAKKAKKVIGIDFISDAIKDAKINSEINGINNTSFFAGDIKDVLTPFFIEQNGKPDVVILDPPRAGLLPGVLEVIKVAAPVRIVYVSCNPATQARDINLLLSHYEVIKVQPVDMFPHTHHVENVVLLEKKLF